MTHSRDPREGGGDRAVHAARPPQVRTELGRTPEGQRGSTLRRASPRARGSSCWEKGGWDLKLGAGARDQAEPDGFGGQRISPLGTQKRGEIMSLPEREGCRSWVGASAFRNKAPLKAAVLLGG